MAEYLEKDVYVFPLSHAQKRLWFFEQVEPGSSVYHVPIGLRLIGPLQVEGLRSSLDAIVERHESLRTTFGQEDGQPVQMIHPTLPLEFALYDLEGVPEPHREEQALLLLQEETHRPFDLEQGPLFRASLVRLHTGEHLLLLSLHHIVVDGWSVDLLLQELTERYTAWVSNRDVDLPDLPLQYPDYAVWQEQWLQGEVLESQIAYWKEHLGEVGAIAPLQLPTDRARKAKMTYAGANESRLLADDLAQGLQAISQAQGTTLFMTLLAAFLVLLYRYTDQEVIRIGTPVAGRPRSELEGIIGFFVNTLVIQNRLHGQMTFQELLADVRDVSIAAYSHQDLPFEKLVEELAPKRDLSHSPLFQVMFALRDEPESFTWPELDVQVLEVGLAVAKVDLTLQVERRGHKLEAALNYNSDLFELSTIQRMLEHYNSLLVGIVADPAQSLDHLPLVTDHELRLLIREWNNTSRSYPRDLSVQELFEAQVQQTPDATALVSLDQRLTYREANERANRLAHYLLKAGVSRESRVGLLMERSVEMIIALLAILKAGGTYVPVDPNAPAERVAFQLRDAEIGILLTQQHLLALHPDCAAHAICFEHVQDALLLESIEIPPLQSEANQPLYLMYTSGSTGYPKGVMVSHRNVVRLVRDTNYVSITAQDVFLQMASIAFDAATFEIWGSLLNGATLALLPPHIPSLHELGNAFSTHGVTIAFLTTSLLHQLVETDLTALASMRQLLVGGEVLSQSHALRALEALPNCRLSNVYGPTENTTFSSYYPLTQQISNMRSIPIGQPISNTQLYVLNSEQQLCPIGVPGEIYAGGDGVALGYMNRPQFNEEKFVNVASLGQERLYRTGDLARWLPDGNLEFLGRIDNQVKLRGFRIELGEVEAALLQHSSVREAVVHLREDVHGEKRLVAYLVADHQEHTDDGSTIEWAVRRFLQDKLPDYMIPSAYVQLTELPLNRNGKVDRHALPVPGIAKRALETEYIAPRTERERLILSVWQELLQIEKIGIHDNFFDLNGHSLLLIKMHHRLEELFNVQIPVVELFRNPTIDALQKYLQPALQTVPAVVVAEPSAPHRMEKRREAILRRKGKNQDKEESK